MLQVEQHLRPPQLHPVLSNQKLEIPKVFITMIEVSVLRLAAAAVVVRLEFPREFEEYSNDGYGFAALGGSGDGPDHLHAGREIGGGA